MENFETSESIAKIAEALSKFQKEVPAIVMDSEVKVATSGGPGYKFAFATLENCIWTIKETMSASWLAYTQIVVSDGVITMLMHSSGEYLRWFFGLEFKGKPQEIGSLISYMRRYSLFSILGIVGQEDDDANIASWNDVESNKKTKPWYNDFNKMKDRWAELVKSGAKTPEDIIKTLEVGFKISTETRENILNLGK